MAVLTSSRTWAVHSGRLVHAASCVVRAAASAEPDGIDHEATFREPPAAACSPTVTACRITPLIAFGQVAPKRHARQGHCQMLEANSARRLDQGTGSKPCPPNGRQRSSLRAASQVPRPAP
jgi:hypothetical protein